LSFKSQTAIERLPEQVTDDCFEQSTFVLY